MLALVEPFFIHPLVLPLHFYHNQSQLTLGEGRRTPWTGCLSNQFLIFVTKTDDNISTF